MTRHDEAGTGLIDVMMATGLLTTLVLLLTSMFASVSKIEMQSSVERYATVVANEVLDKAIANGCGVATGYGDASGNAPLSPSRLAQQCTWGSNGISVLGNVASGAVDSNCQAVGQPSGIPGPACFQVDGISRPLGVGLMFHWAWANGTPVFQMTGMTGSPPDEVVDQVTVEWQPPGAASPYIAQRQRVQPVPATLTTAWQTGSLGMVLVEILNSASPEPVGLVVPTWQQAGVTGPIVESQEQDGAFWAVFPYVPIGGGYKVWVGSSSDMSGAFSVVSTKWTTVSLAPN